MKVAIVIPAYNESTTLGTVIKGVKDVFRNKNLDFEIVVVDDGSKDDTAQVASQRKVKLISHIINIGSGGATATGLSYAQQKGFDLAATLDADGQHRPEDVIKGIDLMLSGGGDLLIGSRLIDSRGMSKIKILGNRGLSLITFITFGVYVTDSQSGLRIFSRKALDELKWRTSGYEFCSEMLWRARQKKLIIKEYPILAIYTDYSISKGQNNWNAINIIKSLVQRRLLEIFGE